MFPVIELEQLTVQFGKVQALKKLSGAFSGRSIGLLGPNGAGKTTLIHTLLGFYRPAHGTARVFGKDVRKAAREIRALVGYMPEIESFIGGMTAVRFVAMMAELTGIPGSSALERARDIAVNAAPVSVAISKRLIWEGLTTSVAEMKKREDALFAWAGNQVDATEGVDSFLEKRAPEWKLSVARDKPDLLSRGG